SPRNSPVRLGSLSLAATILPTAMSALSESYTSPHDPITNAVTAVVSTLASNSCHTWSKVSRSYPFAATRHATGPAGGAGSRKSATRRSWKVDRYSWIMGAPLAVGTGSWIWLVDLVTRLPDIMP